ncbi:hypothetical protein [Arthrobacter sp. HMWF013]|uniref:hypothetical protein n=1 Tax=Arthrobacter sp. HMWF013 TaxID=2056849 RepID=UPI0011B24635|nr:hypothetical protein [Arthrobacter sp. HMWF013]
MVIESLEVRPLMNGALWYVRFMTEILWGRSVGQTFHRTRAEILELGVRLELLIGGAIAAGYGQSASTAQELQHEMLGRLSIEQRISLLKRILDRKELTDNYPFVVPVLSRLFELRNAVAHSLSDGYDSRTRDIRLISFRKGVEKTTTYNALYLHWLIMEQCPAVERELAELYFSIAPPDASWHEN